MIVYDETVLGIAKREKITAVRKRTVDLLMSYSYGDSPAYSFPLSENRIAELSQLTQNRGLWTTLGKYPFYVIDESGAPMEVASEQALANFGDALAEFIFNAKNGGGSLIYQVGQCTTVEQVEAIVDSR